VNPKFFLGLVSFNAWVVIGLTWIVMPILGRLLQWWLFPTGRESNTNAV
jgi:antibiotic biosynthesis monooxygenase (ABM) superfamily enzyme